LKLYALRLKDRLASLHPRWLQAGGMLAVAALLLAASAAFGLFGSSYDVSDVKGYNQLYPAGTTTPAPTSTPVTSFSLSAWDRGFTT
jgi:hypothetical protein